MSRPRSYERIHSSSTRRQGGRRLLGRIAAVYGAGLGLVAVAWAQILAPWWADPAAPRAVVDARWEAVERHATPRLPAGDPSLLHAVTVAMKASTPRAPEGPMPESSLDPASRRAIDFLVAWDGAGGGLGEDPCIGPRVSLFLVFAAARLAILSASGPDDPKMEASLRLASALRDRGPATAGMVGHALVRQAIERFEGAGWAPTRALAELRPRREDVVAIVAREMMCSARYADAALRSGELSPRDLAEDDLERLVAVIAFDLDHELFHLRADLGARFERVLAADEPTGVVAALAAPEVAPPALFARHRVVDLERLAAKLYAGLERIDEGFARLERARRGARRG